MFSGLLQRAGCVFAIFCWVNLCCFSPVHAANDLQESPPRHCKFSDLARVDRFRLQTHYNDHSEGPSSFEIVGVGGEAIAARKKNALIVDRIHRAGNFLPLSLIHI